MPRERPILMSAPMVRAVLAGTKTQTRRAVRIQPNPLLVAGAQFVDRFWCWLNGHDGSITDKVLGTGRCPYGVSGDRLWVRERFRVYLGTHCVEYFADAAHDSAAKWKPSIHMPRWASRITLEITDVRVERLQEISEADALAEGKPTDSANSPRIWYSTIWQSINGPGSWEDMLQAAYRMGMETGAKRAAKHCDNFAQDCEREGDTAMAVTGYEIAIDIEEFVLAGANLVNGYLGQA